MRSDSEFLQRTGSAGVLLRAENWNAGSFREREDWAVWLKAVIGQKLACNQPKFCEELSRSFSSLACKLRASR